MDDLELLRRHVCHGDQTALECLIEKYRGMVLAICRRRLRNGADAEDAAQEVFLALTRDAGKITSNLPGWLHRCAANITASMIRARQNRTHRERQNGWRGGESYAAGDAMHQEAVSILDDCLGQLAPTDREMLIQNCVMERPQKAIASSLGISQQAVGKRIRRTITHLRHSLVRRGVLISTLSALAALGRRVARAAVPKSLQGILTSSAARQVATVGLVNKIKFGTTAVAALFAIAITYECTVNQPVGTDPGRATPRSHRVLTSTGTPGPGAALTPAGRGMSRTAEDSSSLPFGSPAGATPPVTQALPVTAAATGSADQSQTPALLENANRTPSKPTALYPTLAAGSSPTSDTQLHPEVTAKSPRERPHRPDSTVSPEEEPQTPTPSRPLAVAKLEKLSAEAIRKVVRTSKRDLLEALADLTQRGVQPATLARVAVESQPLKLDVPSARTGQDEVHQPFPKAPNPQGPEADSPSLVGGGGAGPAIAHDHQQGTKELPLPLAAVVGSAHPPVTALYPIAGPRATFPDPIRSLGMAGDNHGWNKTHMVWPSLGVPRQALADMEQGPFVDLLSDTGQELAAAPGESVLGTSDPPLEGYSEGAPNSADWPDLDEGLPPGTPPPYCLLPEPTTAFLLAGVGTFILSRRRRNIAG